MLSGRQWQEIGAVHAGAGEVRQQLRKGEREERVMLVEEKQRERERERE
jgi:hypothetical protein